MGRDACAFSCAEQYLASAPHLRPTCLIVDIHMPGMSGLEMQAVLAASGDRTPIIFMTGFPDDQVQSQALACGAVAVLAKPFSTEALCQCIATAVRRGEGDTSSG